MDFGMQFFPCVGPETKPADQYFQECLSLVGLADELGYSHIRIVEHYFHPYGGTALILSYSCLQHPSARKKRVLLQVPSSRFSTTRSSLREK